MDSEEDVRMETMLTRPGPTIEANAFVRTASESSKICTTQSISNGRQYQFQSQIDD